MLRGPTLNFAGRTTLSRLTALLSEANVMLANNTGPLHLAAALGRPVVAPILAQSAGDGAVWIAERRRGDARLVRGQPGEACPAMECMTELTPERRWPRLEEVLRTWEIHKRSA